MKYFLSLCVLTAFLYSCKSEEVNQQYLNKLFHRDVFFDSIITYKIKGDTFFLHFPNKTNYRKWMIELELEGNNKYVDSIFLIESTVRSSKKTELKQRSFRDLFEVDFKNSYDAYVIIDTTNFGGINLVRLFCKPWSGLLILNDSKEDGIRMQFLQKGNSDTLKRIFMQNDNGKYLVINFPPIDSLRFENETTRKFVIDSLQSFGAIFNNLKNFEKKSD